MFLLIITILFLLLYAGLIYYYYYHWKKLRTFEPQKRDQKTFSSVIVAARNEEKALLYLLQALQSQTYPKHLYEVIIVNDFSTDGTEEAANPFRQSNIQIIQSLGTAATSSKKKAIERGIQQAKGELIIITDADCVPHPEWLHTMSSFYKEKGAVFIAAPVKYSYNHSLIQKFQAIDFMVLQGITAASVAANFHTMCNGANLAYTKDAFFSVQGFEGIDAIASGDDMLLMYKIWKKNKDHVLYLKAESAMVTTAPAATWKEFIAQRRRWASKTVHYDDNRIFFVLLFVYLFNLLFFVLLIALFLDAFYGWITLLYLGTKTIIEYPFTAAVATFYKEKKLMKYFIVFQPLHILYTVVVGAISQFGTYEWKGRKTK